MSDTAISYEPPTLTHVQDHWWWRSGWKAGRPFYACHLTFANQPELHNLINKYQLATKGLNVLDEVPSRWLHLTMQGIGFVDTISAEEISHIEQNLLTWLGNIKQPTVTFQHPTIQKEALYLRALPKENLYDLRLAMYRAILSALGPQHFQETKPKLETFRPHVSFAYVNSQAPVRVIEDKLRDVSADPVTATFRHASLLVFHRDNRMYEWIQAIPIPIGTINDSPNTLTPALPTDNVNL